MRFFIINLDRDQDRFDYMVGELAKLQIEAERIPAVLGTDAPSALKPYFLSKAGQIESALNPGEVGCYASHLSLMLKIVEEDISEPVCVFEDDLEFHAGFKDLCDQIEQIDQPWNIIRLSNPTKSAFRQCAELNEPYKLVEYWRVPNNTGCYVINRAGAEKFLKFKGLRKRAIDEDLRRPWEHGLITKGIVPPPITSNIFDSSLDAIGGSRDKPGRERFKDADGSLRDEVVFRLREFGFFGCLKAGLATLLFKKQIRRQNLGR